MDSREDDLKAVDKDDSVGDNDKMTIFSITNILKSLSKDHQNNIILKENALLRQEVEQLRIELSEQKMENLRMKVGDENGYKNANIEEKKEHLQNKSLKLKDVGKNRIENQEDRPKIPDIYENIIVYKNINPVTENAVSPKISEITQPNEVVENPQIQPEITDIDEVIENPRTDQIIDEKDMEIQPKMLDIKEPIVEQTEDVQMKPQISDAFEDNKSSQELEENFKKLLILNIRRYLTYNQQKVGVNLKLFESIFGCFGSDVAFMLQMRNYDREFTEILSNRFQFLFQNHILMMNQRIHQLEQQRRQKLLKHFRIGMQLENWAQRLEMQLTSVKLLSEVRNAIFKFSKKKNRKALLEVLQNIEIKLEQKNGGKMFS